MPKYSPSDIAELTKVYNSKDNPLEQTNCPYIRNDGVMNYCVKPILHPEDPFCGNQYKKIQKEELVKIKPDNKNKKSNNSKVVSVSFPHCTIDSRLI